MKKSLLLSCCLILFTISTWAQTRVITGQILGASKDTIIGAVINQKGTNNATVTDINGNFSLPVSDTGSVILVVESMGFKIKEINVGDKNEININLEEDKKDDDEVVVMGYYTIKKSDLTGAVSTLSKKDVTAVVGGNVLDNIQGKAAGADIVTTSGQTGQSANIVIRGNRSITANNGPLYVVDGVQYSSLQDINPNDIQSMEVLKDASSTAIYGSRGANGVIIIVTKKGAEGTPRVSVNSYIGESSKLAYPDVMTGQQFADLKLERYRTITPADATPTYQEALTPSEFAAYNAGTSLNYPKEIIHHGSQKDLQVNVSGGTDKIKTYFSLDYFNEKGLLKNDELKRYTGRLNVDYQIFKFMKIGTQTQMTFYDNSKRVNPLGDAVAVNPLIGQPYKADGTLDPNPGANVQVFNPLLDEQPNAAVRQLNTTRIFPTIYAEISPLKGLTARTNMAVNWETKSDGIFNGANSYTRLQGGAVTSQASHDAANSLQYNWQGIINYNKTAKKNHSIGATLLSEVITNKTESFHIEANGQLIPAQLYYNLADNASRLTSSTYSKKALVSFAGRANYSFKSKYLITLTGRTDGASVLAEGHKWAFFPSAAAGWKISEEKFMQSQKVKNILSNLKLRGSWGIAGNSNIDPYSTQSNLTRAPFSYDDQGATAYTFKPQIGNKNTTWEKSSTWDVGVDMGILKDRIVLTFDYYNTHTTDLLLVKLLPPTTGVSQTVSNIGATRNKGQELTLTSVNIESIKKDGTRRKGGFTWSTTLTGMRNREQVLKLDEGVTTMQIIDPNNSSNNKYVTVGSPVNSFYDYQKVGIWQTGDPGIPDYNLANPGAANQIQPGMIKIKDQDGNGVINAADRTVVGSSVPKWSAGLNNEFKIYNFDINFYWFARVGSTISYGYTYNTNGNSNSLGTRQYWTPENASNDLYRPGVIEPNQFLNTLKYQNGSYLKLRSASIGYTLPNALSKKIGMSRLRLYVSGKNLLVFSKIKHYDPEMNGSLSFPTTRLIVGGVNIDF